MNKIIYNQLVKSLKFGKKLPDAIYIHDSLIRELPKELFDFLFLAIKKTEIKKVNWNIVKLSKKQYRFSLLNYPDFFNYAYPAILESYLINLEDYSYKHINYKESRNPPILHRKEAFICRENPFYEQFKQHTMEGEKIGLYENTRIIGTKLKWEQLIKEKGYFLDKKGQLSPNNT